MFKIDGLHHYLLSLLIGYYLLNKPEIALILGFLMMFLFIKKPDKKKIIVCLIIIVLSIIRNGFYYLEVNSGYGIVISSSDNYFILFNGFSKYYVPCENNTYEAFDVLRYKGFVSSYNFTNYESQFDFNQYLKEQFIFKKLEISSCDFIFTNPIRVKVIMNNYLSELSNEGLTVISKLLFNKSNNVLYNNFINENSLFYLLSISSFHLYFFTSFLRTILESKLSTKKVKILSIILIVFLLLISNYKISVFRFLILNLIDQINEQKKLKLKYLDKSFLSLIIIILLEPSYVNFSGFIYNLFLPIFFVFSKDAISTINKKYQNFIRTCLLNVLIIFFSIVQNGYFSLINFIIIPLLSLYIMIIFSVAILNFLFPLHNLVNFLSKGLLIALNPISNVRTKIYMDKNILFILSFIIIFSLLIISLENKRKTLIKVNSLFLVGNLLLFNLPIVNQVTNCVYFINVGQGDSTLIVSQGKYILIDTGGVKNKNLAKETLIPFLQKQNIYYLDYVFLTHQDYDHVGCFEELKNNFIIKNYNKDNNFTNVQVGNLWFKNLNPSISNLENDDSLVLYFEMNNIKYLFMGDASIDVEEKIIKNNNLDIDVLKIGHHGSNTSTSEELLRHITPKIGVISCGRNNYYNHPSSEVLNRLNNYNVEILRTDIEGTIKIEKLKN